MIRNTLNPSNPVVLTIELPEFPRWLVREYADGMFDAIERHPGIGISPGFDSFDAARAYVAAASSWLQRS